MQKRNKKHVSYAQCLCADQNLRMRLHFLISLVEDTIHPTLQFGITECAGYLNHSFEITS